MVDPERVPNDAPPPAGADVELGPLVRHIGYALRRAQLAVFGDFIATLERVDLRPGQFSVLVVIGANPGIVQRQLCEALCIKPANFVPLFNELAQRGLTHRVAIDGRSKGLYLTPEGEALAAQAQRLVDVHQSHISAKIGPAECTRLIATLYQIANLAAVSDGAH